MREKLIFWKIVASTNKTRKYEYVESCAVPLVAKIIFDPLTLWAMRVFVAKNACFFNWRNCTKIWNLGSIMPYSSNFNIPLNLKNIKKSKKTIWTVSKIFLKKFDFIWGTILPPSLLIGLSTRYIGMPGCSTEAQKSHVFLFNPYRQLWHLCWVWFHKI